jgi:hypothetical protein
MEMEDAVIRIGFYRAAYEVAEAKPLLTFGAAFWLVVPRDRSEL